MATVLQLNPVEGTSVVRLASGKTKKTKLKNITKLVMDAPPPEPAASSPSPPGIDVHALMMQKAAASPGAQERQAEQEHAAAELAAEATQEREAAALAIQCATRSRQARNRIGTMSKVSWERRFGSGAGFESADLNGDGLVEECELNAAVEMGRSGIVQGGGEGGAGDDSGDDVYTGFGGGDDAAGSSTPLGEGGDGAASLRSPASGGGRGMGGGRSPSQSPWEGGREEEDLLAAAMSDGGGDTASPGAAGGTVNGLSYTREIEASIEAEIEPRPKTPLIITNDDGEEIELGTDSGCDSIAESDYHCDGSDSDEGNNCWNPDFR